MKLSAHKDQFHDNIWYFVFDGLEADRAEIDFGDDQKTAIFPPRGQITHQYDDGKTGHTVTVTDGDATASIQVPLPEPKLKPKPKPPKEKK